MKTLGFEYFEEMDWSISKVICIVGDFIKYGGYVVKQINRNIALVRHKKFEGNFIIFKFQHRKI